MTPAVAAGGLDPNSVTPGLVGFLATFALVLVSILLFVNMSSRLRRLQRREERDAERRAAEATPPQEAPGEQAPGEQAPGEEAPGEQAPGEEERRGDDGRAS